MALRHILMAAAFVTTVGGTSLLAEPAARESGGGGCPHYSAFPSETCVDESSRVQWCQDKLNTYYPGQGCTAMSPGSEHACGVASQCYTINCRLVVP